MNGVSIAGRHGTLMITAQVQCSMRKTEQIWSQSLLAQVIRVTTEWQTYVKIQHKSRRCKKNWLLGGSVFFGPLTRPLLVSLSGPRVHGPDFPFTRAISQGCLHMR